MPPPWKSILAHRHYLLVLYLCSFIVILSISLLTQIWSCDIGIAHPYRSPDPHLNQVTAFIQRELGNSNQPLGGRYDDANIRGRYARNFKNGKSNDVANYKHDGGDVSSSGYLTTEFGYCLVATPDLKSLTLVNCSSFRGNQKQDHVNLKKRNKNKQQNLSHKVLVNNSTASIDLAFFQWFSNGHLKVKNKCVTRIDSDVFLDECYEEDKAQVWSDLTTEHFILALEFGICLRYSVGSTSIEHEIYADSCFKGCEQMGRKFQEATWFLVKEPWEELDFNVIVGLHVLESIPGQLRHCGE